MAKKESKMCSKKTYGKHAGAIWHRQKRQRCALSVWVNQRFSDIKAEDRGKNHEGMRVRVTESKFICAHMRSIYQRWWEFPSTKGEMVDKRTYFRFSDSSVVVF